MKGKLILGFFGVVVTYGVIHNLTRTPEDRRIQAKKDSLRVVGDSIDRAVALQIDSAKKALEAKQKESEWITDQFSKWDGSHRKLVKAVKQSMNDADSFEHIETRYVESNGSLLLTMKFRGKNAFGAKVINYVTAKADRFGEISELKIDQ